MKYLFPLLLGSVAYAKVWKAAVLTDIHLTPGYYANITADSYCEMKPEGVIYTSEVAYMGRMGCDAPIELIEKIMMKMNQSEGQIDILFMPGDFIGHYIPLKPNEPFDEERYKLLTETHD